MTESLQKILMRRRFILAVAAFAGLTGGAVAAEPDKAAAEPAKSCFFINEISGWNRIDDHTLRVSVGPRKRYDLTLMSTPPSSLLQENLGIKGPPSGSICTGNGLGVSVITGGIGPRHYPVTKIVLAPTPEQERALKAKEKEKQTQAPGAPT